MSNIDDLLKEKVGNVSFIEIRENKGFKIKDYVIDEGIPLPMKTEKLVDDVKEKHNDFDGFKFTDIIDGMIYLIGIDLEFKYNNKYKEILYAYDKNIDKYIASKGTELYSSKNIDEALIYLRAGSFLNPNNKDILFQYGLLLEEKSKKMLEAENSVLGNTILKEAVEIMKILAEKQTLMAYYKLGYYYLHFKKYVEAETMWKKFMENEDTTIEIENLKEDVRHKLETIEDNVLYERGYTEVLEGNFTIGLEKLLPLDKKYSDWWNLKFIIGLGFRQAGDTERAIEYYLEALKINPNQIDIINELGLAYAVKLENDKALEYFNRALDIDKDNYEILCNRSIVKLETGDILGAKKDIDKAYAIEKEDDIVKYCKENIYSRIVN